jgi:hypothetical protein
MPTWTALGERSTGCTMSASTWRMEDVADTLEHEGVAAFAKSTDDLLSALGDKADALRSGADREPPAPPSS